MIIVRTQLITALLLTLLLLLVVQILNQQGFNNRNKNSPFECGFDPQETARLPFSLRFFLLAIIFLIFDIEIALLFPVILGLQIFFLSTSYIARRVFLLILMGGLIHEWNQGTLR
jgi:NADH-ubiquinone oxidoreductase chain 3